MYKLDTFFNTAKQCRRKGDGEVAGGIFWGAASCLLKIHFKKSFQFFEVILLRIHGPINLEIC